jgi:hypothetical protein
MRFKLTIYVFLIGQVFIFSLKLKVPRHSAKRHSPYMSVMLIVFCNVSFLFHLMLFNFTLFYFNVTLSIILMCFCHIILKRVILPNVIHICAIILNVAARNSN